MISSLSVQIISRTALRLSRVLRRSPLLARSLGVALALSVRSTEPQGPRRNPERRRSLQHGFGRTLTGPLDFVGISDDFADLNRSIRAALPNEHRCGIATFPSDINPEDFCASRWRSRVSVRCGTVDRRARCDVAVRPLQSDSGSSKSQGTALAWNSSCTTGRPSKVVNLGVVASCIHAVKPSPSSTTGKSPVSSRVPTK
jgi:hypothetical protein